MKLKRSIKFLTTTFIFALLLSLSSDSAFAASMNSRIVNRESDHVLPGYALLWYENFEDDQIPDGWTVDDLDTDGTSWQTFDFSLIPDLANLAHHGDIGLVSMAQHPNTPTEQVLTDNLINTQSFTVAAGDQIDFVLTLLDPGIADGQVYFWFIDTDAGEPIKLSEYTLTTADSIEFTIDLSAMEGRTGHFAIQHVGQNQSSLCLDCMSYWKASGAFWEQAENGKWKYLYTGQGYLRGQWELINNVWYYFGPDEYMVTGWNYINGNWYYMNPSGAMTFGWQYINGNWYYMNTSGAMTFGWQYINGNWYYMNNSGAMTTGWQRIDYTWYYMNPSGAMMTGWQLINNKWYYFHEGGQMEEFAVNLNGVVYYMSMTDGSWLTNGWWQVGGTWLYIGSDGSPVTGWQYINGYTYYFESSGAMVADSWIDGYYLNANGVWIP